MKAESAFSIFGLLLLPVLAMADPATENSAERTEFEVLAYIDYSNGQKPDTAGAETDFNQFRLTRGYFTFKTYANSWLGMRVTMDVTQDNTGDYKVREKYLYASIAHPGASPFTQLDAEIGLGHVPWLDFEENINPYRCQGTMPIELAGVFNSADAGLSLRGNLLGRLENAKEKTGNSHYDGRYGSWHVGLYNGGGYHAAENNENKVFEGRLTLRPLPDVLPGLQLSYLALFGKGNAAPPAPDYSVNLGMASFEHPRVVLAAQFFETEGNAKGNWITAGGEVLKTQGFSAFGTIKTPALRDRLALFGRYDWFDQDVDDLIADKTAYQMMVAGLAFTLYKDNIVLLVFESTDYEEDASLKGNLPVAGTNLGDDKKFQGVYQIKF